MKASIKIVKGRRDEKHKQESNESKTSEAKKSAERSTSTGKQIGTINVDERPLQLSFGGKDSRTLFIAARTSLYSVRMRNRGR